MFALRFSQFGAPDVLHVQDIEQPVVRQGEVLVEVHAAAINPSDVKNVQGAMEQTTLPRTPGRDFAGVVVEGPQEEIGKPVWGTGGDLGFTRDGSHAQYLLLPQEAVSEKPTNLSFSEAATVGVSYVTAWSALCEVGAITEKDVVVIVGAHGSVGSAGVQIAKWRGATVIGIVRHETQRQRVRELGADEVINTSQTAMREAVMDLTKGRGASTRFRYRRWSAVRAVLATPGTAWAADRNRGHQRAPCLVRPAQFLPPGGTPVRRRFAAIRCEHCQRSPGKAPRGL